jgi:ribosomal protein S18 acetylase RimI-like enzyme
MPPPIRAASAYGISYRPKTGDDLPFIERLYASTRAEEMAMTGWPEAFQRQFIAQQQFAQSRQLELNHPGAEWLIIERGGEPVGRLYVEDRDSDLWLVDIALMPETRGAGIGTAVLRDLLEQGREAGKPVGLTVFKANKARHLYAKLGFVATRETEVYDEMVWRGDPDGGAGETGG